MLGNVDLQAKIFSNLKRVTKHKSGMLKLSLTETYLQLYITFTNCQYARCPRPLITNNKLFNNREMKI